jgi:hypothetical protein
MVATYKPPLNDTEVYLNTESTIEKATAAFEHWRSNRTARGPIPPELWELAYEVSQCIGPY